MSGIAKEVILDDVGLLSVEGYSDALHDAGDVRSVVNKVVQEKLLKIDAMNSALLSGTAEGETIVIRVVGIVVGAALGARDH